ncbi:caspase family protein [Roseibacillus persicicus]|uniref:Peptidase C14 caspase domain-containing protein n=1 Tax=Roseibacillus persicicus TaxID=454148 RepID=A0A918TIN3_9BACT|nr:caspase family protein [Roseibacillus persicicus]GHC49387.1 hypothetical protein GCM10007100_14170 [Roseibacillus persicicus]
MKLQAALALFFSILTTLSAENLAVVIGNSDYNTKTGDLPSAASDARLVAEILAGAGFQFPFAPETLVSENLTAESLRSGIRRNRTRFQDANLVILYYAGHGAQVKNDLIFLGVDAVVPPNASDSMLLSEGKLFASIVPNLKPTNGVGMLVIFDACRIGSAAGQGVINYGNDVGVICSTQPLQRADNAKDKVSASVFTETFAQAMKDRKTVRESFELVSQRMRRETDKTPAFYLEPTSRIASFKFPPTTYISPSPVQKLNVSATRPLTYPDRLYLTSQVGEGVNLRQEPGGKSEGILVQHNDSARVGFTNKSEEFTENSVTSYPVKVVGWALSRNIKTGKEFLTRESGRFTVLSEAIKIRPDANLSLKETSKLSPGATGKLLNEFTTYGNYDWQKVEWTGWATAVSSSGKTYLSALEGGGEIAPTPNQSTQSEKTLAGSFTFKLQNGQGQAVTQSQRSIVLDPATPNQISLFCIENDSNNQNIKSRVLLTGEWNGNRFSGDQQTVLETGYTNWANETFFFEFNDSRTQAQAVFSYSPDGKSTVTARGQLNTVTPRPN